MTGNREVHFLIILSTVFLYIYVLCAGTSVSVSPVCNSTQLRVLPAVWMLYLLCQSVQRASLVTNEGAYFSPTETLRLSGENDEFSSLQAWDSAGQHPNLIPEKK